MRRLASLLCLIFFILVLVLVLVLVLSFSNILRSQTKIEDKASVEMAERTTHRGWSFKYPKSKRRFGIEWNWTRSYLWSWNRSNRRYKNGRDIRPLKPWGEQTLRGLSLLVQEEETKKIKDEVDMLATTTAKEFAHWSNKVVNLDPLWQTYYKDKLTDFRNFPEEPSNYDDWGFSNEAIFNKLNDTGLLEYLQEDLELLKNKFEISRKTDMPRGKRIMMYDEIVHEWEEFSYKVKNYEEVGQALVYMEEAKDKKINIKSVRTDKEIMESVMAEYKDKF